MRPSLVFSPALYASDQTHVPAQQSSSRATAATPDASFDAHFVLDVLGNGVIPHTPRLAPHVSSNQQEYIQNRVSAALCQHLASVMPESKEVYVSRAVNNSLPELSPPPPHVFGQTLLETAISAATNSWDETAGLYTRDWYASSAYENTVGSAKDEWNQLARVHAQQLVQAHHMDVAQKRSEQKMPEPGARSREVALRSQIAADAVGSEESYSHESGVHVMASRKNVAVPSETSVLTVEVHAMINRIVKAMTKWDQKNARAQIEKKLSSVSEEKRMEALLNLETQFSGKNADVKPSLIVRWTASTEGQLGFQVDMRTEEERKSQNDVAAQRKNPEFAKAEESIKDMLLNSSDRDKAFTISLSRGKIKGVALQRAFADSRGPVAGIKAIEASLARIFDPGARYQAILDHKSE